MDKHNYVRGIQDCCEQHGLDLIYRDDDLPCIEPILNKTTFFMFEKVNSDRMSSFAGTKYVSPDENRYELEELETATLICPITDTMYPSVNGIRLINPNYAFKISGCSSLV